MALEHRFRLVKRVGLFRDEAAVGWSSRTLSRFPLGEGREEKGRDHRLRPALGRDRRRLGWTADALPCLGACRSCQKVGSSRLGILANPTEVGKFCEWRRRRKSVRQAGRELPFCQPFSPPVRIAPITPNEGRRGEGRGGEGGHNYLPAAQCQQSDGP